jgi:hypothetical protein
MDNAKAVTADSLLTEMSIVDTEISSVTASLAKECKQTTHLADEIGTSVYDQFAKGTTLLTGEETLLVEYQARKLLALLEKFRTLRKDYDQLIRS